MTKHRPPEVALWWWCPKCGASAPNAFDGRHFTRDRSQPPGTVCFTKPRELTYKLVTDVR